MHPDASVPPGLHLHLVTVGPTARLAVWLEQYPDPNGYLRSLTERYPVHHPGCAEHPERPAWIPEGAPRATFTIRVPCISNGNPVPLPGAMLGWELHGFTARGRSIGERTILATGWLIPPALSLGPLRRLIVGWRERYGAGFVSPGATAWVPVIDELLSLLREGPLLPTLDLPDTAGGDPVDAWLRGPRPEQPLVWVPPVSLDLVDRLAAAAAAAPRLWAPERSLSRFARFLVAILGAAPAEPPALVEPWTADRLRAELVKGTKDVLEVHRSRGSCLYPQHVVFVPPAAPAGHLSGRIDSAGAEGTEARPLQLSLGVEHGESFLPLHALAAPSTMGAPPAPRTPPAPPPSRLGAVRARGVEHEGRAWLRPSAVAARDWAVMSAREPSLFRLPELLVEGTAPISEAESEHLLAAGEQEGPWHALAWFADAERIEGVPKPDPGDRAPFACFSVAPGKTGAVRLRVRWTPVEDPEAATSRGRGLGEVYFSAEMDLLMGDRDLPVAAAEAWLRETSTPLFHAGTLCVYRSSLENAVALAHARLAVIRSLERPGRGVRHRDVVDLEDTWADEPEAPESVFSQRWQAFVERIAGGRGVPDIGTPPGFTGTLRPYQARGASWLSFLLGHGVGACLGDDMGLGKTVQVLAVLCQRAAGRSGPAPPSLVVCPTSVVTNWEREAARFAPGLRVHVHEGAGRARDGAAFEARVAGADLVVTSFALLRQDQAIFADRSWDLLAVDEAQNIKTPEAKQTRALKRLRARARVALTGTPVENHLRDLWSIFDFAEPGVLGAEARFLRTIAGPVRSGDPRALAKLSRRVGPLLLRRTKRDPEIAPDLPDKQEQDVVCELGREQAALYRAVVEATLHGLADKTGMLRRAHILTALLRLKQICNHPESFAAQAPRSTMGAPPPSPRLLGRSGKLDRVLDLLGELLEEGQPALVFTQLAGMGHLLVRAVDERFGVSPPFFHGGLGPADRDRMVADFQSPEGPPLLVVSLRAGGTGINLTRATAVIHYDRWWNPAVEDQAVGRAHRIGQSRGVNVYRMVTRGTIEEHVQRLLDDKRALARTVLGAADGGFLTELDDEALGALLRLDEAVDDGAEPGPAPGAEEGAR
jgi:superfamily II DNA or RNA helicase